MSITIFGIIWLIVLLVCFFNNKAKYMVGITLFSMVFQASSVLLFGGRGVGPQLITSFVMIVWSIVHSSCWESMKLRISLGNSIKNLSMIGVTGLIVIIMISRKANYDNYDMEEVLFYLQVLQLLIYVVCYIRMWSIGSKLKTDEINQIMLSLACVVALVGILQFCITTGTISKSILWETFLYTPDTDSAYYWYDYYPRVFATFMEPSYCGAFLVGSFYYLISLEKLNRFHIGLSLILVAEIILTLSSTAYGAFAICGVLYVILGKKKKSLKYLVPIAFCVILVLLATGSLQEVMDEVIFSKAQSASARARGSWDNKAIEQFVKSPMWGVGYKNVRASQFILSLAGQLGITGVLAWVIIWIPVVIQWWRDRINNQLKASMLFALSTVIALCIAIPDIDNITFWQGMYLFGLVGSSYRYRGQKANSIKEL